MSECNIDFENELNDGRMLCQKNYQNFVCLLQSCFWRYRYCNLYLINYILIVNRFNTFVLLILKTSFDKTLNASIHSPFFRIYGRLWFKEVYTVSVSTFHLDLVTLLTSRANNRCENWNIDKLSNYSGCKNIIYYILTDPTFDGLFDDVVNFNFG